MVQKPFFPPFSPFAANPPAMRRKLFLLFLIGPVLIFLAILFLLFFHRSEPDGSLSPVADTVSFQKIETDEAIVSAAISRSSGSLPGFSILAGGVTPHHLLAAEMIADFYRTISSSGPERIILLGPNHAEAGPGKIISSFSGWETAFGKVLPDISAIKNLENEGFLKTETLVLANDISLTSQLPFLASFFPQAKVIPLLLSGRLSLEESEIFAGRLFSFVDDKTLVIASVDFSHYLSSVEAAKKDEITWEAICNFDYPRLYSFNSDHLDSPPSLGILLMIMDKLGAKPVLLKNLTSGQLTGDFTSSSTSYFTFVFERRNS